MLGVNFSMSGLGDLRGEVGGGAGGEATAALLEDGVVRREGQVKCGSFWTRLDE